MAQLAGVHFGDRLARHVLRRESQIVLGLDPDPARLWPSALSDGDSRVGPAASAAGPAGGASGPAKAAGRTAAQAAAAAVTAHCRALIDAAGPACVAVKPQLACFERLGAPGREALGAVCAHAQAADLIVLADAKRGDIDVSARAYAQALLGVTPTPFGDVDGLGADAMTASLYMGVDTLASLLDVARPAGAGVFVLVRTSNPGAADVEDAALATGAPVWEHVAQLAAAAGAPGPESGLNDVGAVVGATAPEHIARMRELMPATPFLLPGIGAQGGRVEDVAPAFAPGRAGGLVTASRSIARAHEAHGGGPADAARVEAERLRAAAWALTP